jgi:hypothetical protein
MILLLPLVSISCFLLVFLAYLYNVKYKSVNIVGLKWDTGNIRGASGSFKPLIVLEVVLVAEDDEIGFDVADVAAGVEVACCGLCICTRLVAGRVDWGFRVDNPAGRFAFPTAAKAATTAGSWVFLASNLFVAVLVVFVGVLVDVAVALPVVSIAAFCFLPVPGGLPGFRFATGGCKAESELRASVTLMVFTGAALIVDAGWVALVGRCV